MFRLLLEVGVLCGHCSDGRGDGWMHYVELSGGLLLVDVGTGGVLSYGGG